MGVSHDAKRSHPQPVTATFLQPFRFVPFGLIARTMSTQTPQPIRGTQDIFGPDAEAFAFVVETFERVRKLYRFRRVEMPVFEKTAVFSRSLGETTDVVSKEMYSFEDRGGESLTLRPEFTAGIARAYLTDGWQQYAPLKVATHGPLFRYERPQKGRYRQFHQIDAEIIGAGEPQADVELLVMADQLLKELGIGANDPGAVTLQLNTLGDGASREAWRAALVEYFRAHKAELSEDSQDRLERNPLRILDSKDPRDKPFTADAPRIDDFLSAEAQDFFGKVTSGLDAAGVEWTRAPALVRGLDYYRHTAFEFVTDRLGAQGTVLGGGRYDGLMEALGGAATPAVGWAAGIERLAMLVGESDVFGPDRPLLTVIPDRPDDETIANKIATLLRRAGVSTDIAFRGNAKRRFELAKKNGSRARLVIRRSANEGVPERLGHHIVVNQPDSFDPAPPEYRDLIFKVLEDNFEIVRMERATEGYWLDGILRERA